MIKHALTALLLLFLLLTACTSSQPTGCIGFSSALHGNAQIYTTNIDTPLPTT